MAHKRQIKAAVLNINLHPHSKETYRRWLYAIFRQRLPAKVYGDRYGVISAIKSENDNSYVTGSITTFTKIDMEQSWYDVVSLQEATSSDMESITIPENLYPNTSSYLFHFDLSAHKMIVQAKSGQKSLSPALSANLMRNLGKASEVEREYGEPLITIEKESSALDRMFGLEHIRRIEITILRPNVDVFSPDFEKNIEDHLEKNKAKSMRMEYIAANGGTLTPDEELKEVAQVGLKSGEVEVHGRDENGAATMSSKEFPVQLQKKYDPDKLSEQQAFERLLRAYSDG